MATCTRTILKSDPERNSTLLAVTPDAPSPPVNPDAWKVLVVDDEEDVHAVLRLALQDMLIEHRPLQLLDAHSAEQAKGVLTSNPDIALILLDVVMESDRAGLHLVRYVRDELANRSVQIVLITGQIGRAHV